MTKLSKRNLDPKDMGLYVSNIWIAFSMLGTKDEIRSFVKELFTHTEYKMFAKRLEIARRLLEGQTYEEIKEALKVTEKPITNLSNILANGGDGIRNVHKKLGSLERKHSKRKTYFPRYKHTPRLSEIVKLFNVK